MDKFSNQCLNCIAWCKVLIDLDSPSDGKEGGTKLDALPTETEFLVSLLAGRRNNRLASQDHSDNKTTLSSPPNESHIKGYIQFLGINNKKDTFNILLANEVRELGLTLGVTVLFDNVAKYDQYLASQK
ncbi:hypothetical protein VP01_2161g4 [Puccinia sorghi]|uniref:Uncharacterized protein n=1 Tax=Puccinia sorghi TaxID=27349 RepID=A0A0L6V9K0_9BASI|nr:hypothetical protein VP01_2161g4 [Puccinia sorghi]